jgi:cytoskeletal protein CcmA (bactofilin family)
MHADRELPPNEAVAIELHLTSCAECRMRLAGLRSEASIVAAALAHDAEPVVLPPYRRPVSRVAMAATAAGGMFVAILIAVASDLVSGLLQGPVTWFNPFDAGTFADLSVEAAIFLAKHGGAIMAALAKTALMAVFTTLIGWFAFSRRGRRRGPLLLTALLAVVVLQPLPSQALEIRHDETAVFVAAGETIDDTLMAFGETVEITGDVTGDLIAVGRRVVISGHVGGQVFTAAKNVTITGEVDGSVVGIATDTLGVASPRIGRNVYAAGSTVELSPAARVAANAVVAGEHVQLAGSVGRDVFGGADDFNVSATIGGALTAYAGHIALLGPARVAGNVTAHVKHANDLSVSPGAVIGGELETAIMKTHADRSEYLTAEFYAFQLARFAAAFFAAAILLALVPSLRRITIDSASGALVAGGIGLVTLVATPLIAVLVAFTLVGLPIAVFGLMLWAVGLYVAKLVVAYFVGTRLMETSDKPRHYTVILAVGLAILIVVINVPFIGGVFSFLLEILGLGLLVLFLKRTYEGNAEHA